MWLRVALRLAACVALLALWCCCNGDLVSIVTLPALALAVVAPERARDLLAPLLGHHQACLAEALICSAADVAVRLLPLGEVSAGTRCPRCPAGGAEAAMRPAPPSAVPTHAAGQCLSRW